MKGPVCNLEFATCARSISKVASPVLMSILQGPFSLHLDLRWMKSALDKVGEPDIAYFVVRPRWICYSDYDQKPPIIEEITISG